MKKTMFFEAFKRIFAILLCTAISLAYAPLLNNGWGRIYAAVPEDSSWEADDVKAISFVPSANSSVDRFIFYQGIDEETLTKYIWNEDEQKEESVEYQGYYSGYFENGDKIIATLVDGSKKTLIYSEDEEDNYWLIEGENAKLSSDIPIITDNQYEERWTNPGKYPIYIEFGSYYDESKEDWVYPTATIEATVKSNPVTSFDYVPVSQQSFEERCTIYDGDEAYFFFDDGDKIIATIDNIQRTYTYNRDRDEFLDNNHNPYPFEIELDQEELEDADVGTYTIYLKSAGFSEEIEISIIENPISALTYTPVQERSYSEAEMYRHYEWFYPADEEDDESKANYTYWLPCEEGDKLTISWKNSDPDSVYTYVDGDEELSPGVYSAFIDKDGNALFVNDVLEYENGETRITAGNYQFEINYKGITASLNVEITESTDAEIELAEAKRDAENALYDIDAKYDLGGKIERKEYRQAQENELYKAWDKALDAIEKANSKAELDRIVATYEAEIKAVKTDAQLKAEEAAAKRAADELKEWNGTVSGAVPKVKSAKFKAAKKKVTVSWKKANKKNLKKFDKVEVQVCPNKSFLKANSKRVEVKKTKKSATVKGLKKGTYYVRVRNVKGSGTGKLVSKWSKVKKVKVK